MSGAMGFGGGTVAEEKNWTDPRDIEFVSAGNGTFTITRLQEKPCTLYIRNKDQKPFLCIEVNEKGFKVNQQGFQIFLFTDDE